VDHGAELSAVICGAEGLNVKFAMTRRLPCHQPRRRSPGRRDVIPQRHGPWRRARGPFFEIFPKGRTCENLSQKGLKSKKDGMSGVPTSQIRA
jgi:hypothetical protein